MKKIKNVLSTTFLDLKPLLALPLALSILLSPISLLTHLLLHAPRAEAYSEFNDNGSLRLGILNQTAGLDFRLGTSNFALGFEVGSSDPYSNVNNITTQEGYTRFSNERYGIRGVFFFTRHYNSGFYLSSTVSQVHVKADNMTYSTGVNKVFESNYITGNLVLGHRWYWDTLSLYVGAKKVLGTPNTKVLIENPDHTTKECESGYGDNPSAEVAIGFNF